MIQNRLYLLVSIFLVSLTLSCSNSEENQLEEEEDKPKVNMIDKR